MRNLFLFLLCFSFAPFLLCSQAKYDYIWTLGWCPACIWQDAIGYSPLQPTGSPVEQNKNAGRVDQNRHKSFFNKAVALN